jgi:3D (Asp-Asp-Asp) domain-containing protein
VRRPIEHAAPPAAERSEIFANTYYDFPTDHGEGDTPLYDASCRPIARVSRAFHDRVCVQGSGRLASGVTVSFAARGCACAERCPRTGQQICDEALDPARFPNGRGATGRPITPLSTVAVDPAVIPLGSSLYVPELAGLPRPDGSPHDGCFVAEDRGLRIKGLRLDVFAGEEQTRRAWEAAVPSHRGVHVVVGDPRCAARR